MIVEKEKGHLLSSFSIKVKEVKLEREICKQNQTTFKFYASDGWLRNYLRRKGYTLRRITTTGRELPADCLEKVAEFLNECERLIVGLNSIINMEKTGIYLDSASNFF